MLAVADNAAAQAGANRATAEALFEEGRRLMADGKHEQACPKLESSQRLDPGVGTLLNLGDCYAKLGRTASAWATFREAGSAARAQGSAEREAVARERASSLEPQLSYLTVVQWKGQSVAITRNGSAVDPAMLDTPIPVDPGEHVIVAASPGKREWSTTVKVAPGGDQATVTIPILPDDAPTPVGQEAPVMSGAAVASADVSDGSTQRWLAVSAGAVGVVGLVAGTIFGLSASADWDDAKACQAEPSCMNADRLSSDASSTADLATVAFIVGGLGVAGGLVLWFTAPSAGDGNASSVALGLGMSGVTVRGRL